MEDVGGYKYKEELADLKEKNKKLAREVGILELQYVECELCGEMVPNEQHFLIAHAHTHSRKITLTERIKLFLGIR